MAAAASGPPAIYGWRGFVLGASGAGRGATHRARGLQRRRHPFRQEKRLRRGGPRDHSLKRDSMGGILARGDASNNAAGSTAL